MNFPHAQRFWALLIALAFEGGLAALAWPLGWVLGLSPVEHCSVTVGGSILGVAASLPMVAVFGVLIRWPMGPLERVKQLLDDVLVPFLGSCTLIELALISLVAGLGEELLFRGVLQIKLAQLMGFWPGLVLASLLFGLMHPLSVTYVVLAASFGIYLGWIFTITADLFVAMIAHAVYDFVALAYLLKGRASITTSNPIQDSDVI